MFFEKQGPIWDTLRDLESNLQQHDIPYVVVGAMAVNVHGHERTTKDVDICLDERGWEKLQDELIGTRYERVPKRARRFRDPRYETTFDVLIAGRVAGRASKQQAVKFPDPVREAEVHGDVRTISLARLIELKLVTWRLQDWADVISLIRVHDLDESFAEQLDPVARSAYVQCYDQKVDEDRYEEEQGGF